MSRTEEQHPEPSRTPLSRNRRAAGEGEQRLEGLGIHPGIAVGPAAFAAEAPAPVVVRVLDPDAVPAELDRLDEAVRRSLRQLEKLRARLAVLSEQSQAEITPLLDAYRQMLGPSRLLRAVRARIENQRSGAEAAVAAESERLALALLDRAPDGPDPDAPDPDAEEGRAALRRAEEVREIGRRLVRNLSRAPFRSFAGVPAGAVLVTEQLRPADAALLDPNRIAAVVMEEGGGSDHTAIMLRALGIPSVIGVASIAAVVTAGTTLVVDGAAGTVVLRPTADTLEEARTASTFLAKQQQKLARLRHLPAQLTGGEVVELQANLELPAELGQVKQSGAAGIGLLRTEFLFINAEALPDEAAQERIYRQIVGAMAGECSTIRLVDWGGEKQGDAMGSLLPPGAELNPALGLRGLRLLLRHPEVMETQLAAILRAVDAGPSRILLPMVTTVAEFRQAREIYERVARRLRRRGIRLGDALPPLGVMIETPAAALGAESLALEAEFLSIGTNDLAMYTLAVDRAEAGVSPLFDPLHPAVLRLIRHTSDAALRLRRPVSLCGEIAGDPRVIPLLMGMGLRSFSMNATALPRVKQVVRSCSLDECRRLAGRALEESEPSEVWRLLNDFAAR